MNFQSTIFDIANEQPLKVADSLDTIFAVTWNVANPSLERAREQWTWLSQVGANILILSEIKASQGCDYLHYKLKEAGYNVFNETTNNDSYGVILAIKGFKFTKIDLGFNYLKSRVISVEIDTFLGKIVVIGLYIPSRGNKEMRNVEKNNFQNQISSFLKCHKLNIVIIGGDLNVVPRNHTPHHPVFGEWEYAFYEDFGKAKLIDAFAYFTSGRSDHTWFSRDMNGFRFDFLFISEKIVNKLSYCDHLHEPRTSKLSDHSAVAIKLL